MTLRRFAIFTASVAFVLILMGGLVHNTRSSLACPDWPLCYGQVFPKMEGGVLVEHSHRIVAFTVSLLTLALLIGSWRRARRTRVERARHAAKIVTVAAALVLVQATLGGITVILRLDPIISTLHLATSQLFLLTLILVAFRSGDETRAPLSHKVQRMTMWGAILVYTQELVGALMRHLGAGLACKTDLLTCEGQVWPTNVHPNLMLHVFHRMFALVVFGHLIGMAIVVAKGADSRLVKTMAIAAPVLAVVQITLGVLSITTFLDAIPVTAHLGVAATILADCAILNIIARGPVRARARVAAPAAHAVEVAA